MIVAPDARIALRARGLLESADLSFRFMSSHGGVIARMFAALAIPGLIASLAMRYLLGVDWFTTWFASFAVAALLEGPFTILCGQLALRKGITVYESLSVFSRRAFAFMLVLIGAALAQGIGLAFLILPWFVLASMMVFLPEIVLLEGGAMGAFRRAARMTSGYRLRAFGLTALLWAVRLIAIVVGDTTLRGTVGIVLDVHTPSESLWSDGGSPYALVGLWVSVPICAVIRYIAYVDFRTIREGWDVQRRFQVLAARLTTEEQS